MSAGALLENGAVLKEIYLDHVVLDRDGKRTDLYIEGAAKPTKIPELLALTDTSPSIRKPVRTASATYTHILRGAPRYTDNQLIGFDVYPGTSSSQFWRLGLRPGDVLAAVNGAPITTQEALVSALKDLSEGQSAVASVIRSGQPIELALDGAVLTQSASPVMSAGPLPH
jgi:general secretion pathway protein C